MDPHTMKYTELKDELKKRNIKCTGSKDELCQKLIEAMSQDGQTVAADPAPQQPAPVEEPTKTISQEIPEATEDKTMQNDADMVMYDDTNDIDLIPADGTEQNLDAVEQPAPVATTEVNEQTAEASNPEMSIEEKIRARQKRFGTMLSPEFLKQQRMKRFQMTEEEKEKSLDPAIVARCKRFNIPLPDPHQPKQEFHPTPKKNTKNNQKPMNRNRMSKNSNMRRQNNKNNRQLQARKQRFANQYDF